MMEKLSKTIIDEKPLTTKQLAWKLLQTMMMKPSDIPARILSKWMDVIGKWNIIQTNTK
jgi:hypothetical protein